MTFSGSSVPGNIKGSTPAATSHPTLCPERLPQQNWPLLRCPEVRSTCQLSHEHLSARRASQSFMDFLSAPRALLHSLHLGRTIPSFQGSEARLLALQSPGAFWLGRAHLHQHLGQLHAPPSFPQPLPLQVSSHEKEYDGDPASPLAFNKGAALLFVVPASRVAERTQKCTAVCQSPPQCRKVPPNVLHTEGSHGGSEKGRAHPRSHSASLFLALISFSFHNFVLSAKL